MIILKLFFLYKINNPTMIFDVPNLPHAFRNTIIEFQIVNTLSVKSLS